MNLTLLIGISLLPLLYYFVPGLPITHDGPDHVARIANFFQSLSEGNPVPRWAANLNWGYGHPILMFLYPLPSYVASLFHVIGLSFVDSTKLLFIVSFIASILVMYLWTKTAFNKRVGFIASLLYGFAPYRFVDMSVRGAIGEHVAFIFPPLICYFLLKLANARNQSVEGMKNIAFAALTVGALILSHNAVSIMFMPIILLYIIYLFFFVTKKDYLFLLTGVIAIILGFGLSSFFWIPAQFEGKYTLRDIVTAGGVSDRFVPWLSFMYSPWSYRTGNELSKSLGLAGWIGIIAGIWAFIREKRTAVRWVLGGLIVLLVGSLFIMTSSSTIIWNNMTLLQKFQFPWRFLSVATFVSAVLGAIGIDAVCNGLKPVSRVIFVGFIIITVVLSVPMWKPKGYTVKPESYYSGIYNSTTDTGESSPIWSIRFMEHRANDPMGVISGSAHITPGTRTSTKHEYNVTVRSPARMVENTLYFPGWKIFVDDKETEIQFQDPDYRGLMTFYVPSGVHTVRVAFTDTKLRKAANLISITVFALMVLSIGAGTLLWQKRT